MTPLALVLLAVAALVPLALSLRRGVAARGRRESAVALHRAQLAELDRDLAEGRIAPAEHTTARLEVQRRLLAADETPDLDASRASRTPVLVAMIAIPLASAALYLIGGHPWMPAVPLAARLASENRADHEAGVLIGTLNQRLAQLDPKSDQARQGYVLLGNIEDRIGHLPEAAAAWRKAVSIRFDPTLAAQAAEAQTRVDGRMSDDSAELFRRALAAAPADAPWRSLVEQRLAQGGSGEPPTTP